MMTSLLSIGSLAREAGVSVQTLRHYDSLGLLVPSHRTSAGYRMYSEVDRARLELIRVFRSLDFDLDTIALILAEAVETRSVVELHLRVLELQAQAITRRRAVLRSLLRESGAIPLERWSRVQQLAMLDAGEQAVFLQGALESRLRHAAPPTLHELITRAADVEFPEEPTDAWLAAWLELAEIVQDPSFLASYRARTERSALMTDTAEIASDFEPAARAATQGVAVNSPQGQVILRQWVNTMSRRVGLTTRGSLTSRARRLSDALTRERDPREARFWELLAELNPTVRHSPVTVAWLWLMSGLQSLAIDDMKGESPSALPDLND